MVAPLECVNRDGGGIGIRQDGKIAEVILDASGRENEQGAPAAGADDEVMRDAATDEHVIAGPGNNDLAADVEAVVAGEHEHRLAGVSVDVALGRAGDVRAVQDSEGAVGRTTVDEDAYGVAARKLQELAVTADLCPAGERFDVGSGDDANVRLRAEAEG